MKCFAKTIAPDKILFKLNPQISNFLLFFQWKIGENVLYKFVENTKTIYLIRNHLTISKNGGAKSDEITF